MSEVTLKQRFFTFLKWGLPIASVVLSVYALINSKKSVDVKPDDQIDDKIKDVVKDVIKNSHNLVTHDDLTQYTTYADTVKQLKRDYFAHKSNPETHANLKHNTQKIGVHNNLMTAMDQKIQEHNSPAENMDSIHTFLQRVQEIDPSNDKRQIGGRRSGRVIRRKRRKN